MRCYRQSFKNPYTTDPTPMSQQEKTEQAELPIWDRVFDHKKYMEHDGPLKLSTGIAYLDVEPFPRMKLMKLYYLALQEISQLPDAYSYKFLSRETTKWRMKVVDENRSIRAIEKKIAAGLIEELIFQAHNEIRLLRLMGKWRPWEHWTDIQDEKDTLHQFAGFKGNDPFPNIFETYDDVRHDKKPRKKAAE